MSGPLLSTSLLRADSEGLIPGKKEAQGPERRVAEGRARNGQSMRRADIDGCFDVTIWCGVTLNDTEEEHIVAGSVNIL